MLAEWMNEMNEWIHPFIQLFTPLTTIWRVPTVYQAQGLVKADTVPALVLL